MTASRCPSPRTSSTARAISARASSSGKLEPRSVSHAAGRFAYNPKALSTDSGSRPCSTARALIAAFARGARATSLSKPVSLPSRASATKRRSASPWISPCTAFCQRTNRRAALVPNSDRTRTGHNKSGRSWRTQSPTSRTPDATNGGRKTRPFRTCPARGPAFSFGLGSDMQHHITTQIRRLQEVAPARQGRGLLVVSPWLRTRHRVDGQRPARRPRPSPLRIADRRTTNAQPRRPVGQRGTPR